MLYSEILCNKIKLILQIKGIAYCSFYTYFLVSKCTNEIFHECAWIIVSEFFVAQVSILLSF
jgi:hypothetical protein